jgi:hypothetical protein
MQGEHELLQLYDFLSLFFYFAQSYFVIRNKMQNKAKNYNYNSVIGSNILFFLFYKLKIRSK